MDGFDNAFGAPAAAAGEVDPAAEFLAQEQVCSDLSKEQGSSGNSVLYRNSWNTFLSRSIPRCQERHIPLRILI